MTTESQPDSDPPEEASGYHELVSRGEYRYDRREAREWRKGMDARLSKLEKKLMLFGLALAALSAGHDIPWLKIAQALAGDP